MPFVSVIIPTYNRKETLKRAIDSVLKQTYKDFELIVVDDGSTDGSDVESLIKDSNVKSSAVILKENSGVSRARNIGVKHAQGEWIAFLDSDDEWHKNKLYKQVAWLKEHPNYLIMQTSEIWIRNGKRVNPPSTHVKVSGDIFEISLKRCMITPSSVIIKKSFFENLGGFNESLPACEDYDLWLKISSKHKIGLLDEYLMTRYGGREDQLSAYVIGLDKFRIRAMMDLITYHSLNDNQENMTRQELVKKANIVAGGYKKRNKVLLYEQYKKIAKDWEAR